MPVTELPSSGDTLILTADLPHLTPDEAFAHWTDPDLLTRWWPEAATIEPHIGGSYHLRWLSHNSIMRGRITEFSQGKMLGFTWSWDHDPEEKEPLDVLVQFDGIDDGTRLTITHGPYADTESARQEREGYAEGWEFFVTKLQTIGTR